MNVWTGWKFDLRPRKNHWFKKAELRNCSCSTCITLLLWRTSYTCTKNQQLAAALEHSSKNAELVRSCRAHELRQVWATLSAAYDRPPTNTNQVTRAVHECVRSSERFWAALSTDLIIEQTKTKSIQSRGGLTRRLSLSESVRILWACYFKIKIPVVSWQNWFKGTLLPFIIRRSATMVVFRAASP